MIKKEHMALLNKAIEVRAEYNAIYAQGIVGISTSTGIQMQYQKFLDIFSEYDTLGPRTYGTLSTKKYREVGTTFNNTYFFALISEGEWAELKEKGE